MFVKAEIKKNVCHVTLQDHVVKVFNDFIVKVCHHLTKFGGQRHCGIGDIVVLICHVISQNQVIK